MTALGFHVGPVVRRYVPNPFAQVVMWLEQIEEPFARAGPSCSTDIATANAIIASQTAAAHVKRAAEAAADGARGGVSPGGRAKRMGCAVA